MKLNIKKPLILMAFQCVDNEKFIAVFKLIIVEGAQTPAGGRDREDPAGRKPEEASGPPTGKRSACNEDQTIPTVT
ncbi:hypothetical protein [Sutcliffiella horikoshii]|uniref:hypothetical protein n=1 Tax=Sutcliffiella horikoshii TaxID=79883 RepID=UPI001F3326B7|nr:hypothetical protein [Sutcliffiella horikoshii]MCG1023131.1 hypothetical protein [Sutcliffiella horikoshii]